MTVAALAEKMVVDSIFVKDGKAIRVEHWVNWNGTPHPVIIIERNGDRFSSHISDPSHGGGNLEGTLKEVTVGLHRNIQAEFEMIFDLDDPAAAMLERVGIEGYTIKQA